MLSGALRFGKAGATYSKVSQQKRRHKHEQQHSLRGQTSKTEGHVLSYFRDPEGPGRFSDERFAFWSSSTAVTEEGTQNTAVLPVPGQSPAQCGKKDEDVLRLPGRLAADELETDEQGSL
ncbi:hypothetical protein HPB52_000962 [Rhipicephalus sanguineus]|uniref:Uncharacterized protein n=1 Tax=Rhipicephalus sanguineus TaxID=34632 RepID=A0A9D4QHK3_RHISA|nr:hypothetical protein HPB52_000962 [Rhipicephalus sanguineus]